jgi:hypothetical protein
MDHRVNSQMESVNLFGDPGFAQKIPIQPDLLGNRRFCPKSPSAVIRYSLKAPLLFQSVDVFQDGMQCAVHRGLGGNDGNSSPDGIF